MPALNHHESNHTGATAQDSASSLGAKGLELLRYLYYLMKL